MKNEMTYIEHAKTAAAAKYGHLAIYDGFVRVTARCPDGGIYCEFLDEEGFIEKRHFHFRRPYPEERIGPYELLSK